MIKKLKKTDEKKFVKVIKKNVNGSVSVFVLSSILLVILVLSVINLGVSNKITAQSEKIKGIEEEYKEASTDERMKQEYINKTKGNKGSDLVDVGKTDGSWSEDKGICLPVIPKNSDMQLVIYDEETQTWVDDETNLLYNYYAEPNFKNRDDSKKSRWANARVTINGVDSYFVWIPRFEYRCDESGVMDVRFISIEKEATPGYTIHQAFRSDVNTGGWGKEIPGFWIGKYEPSWVDHVNNIIKMVPNNYAADGKTVGQCFEISYKFNRKLESHLIKNSEWAAVGVLAHSQYGRSGNEVRINNSSPMEGTYNRSITGMAGWEHNAIENTGSESYNTAIGVLASTTGNVYGVYDMSGCRAEYTSAYQKSGIDLGWSIYRDENGVEKNFASKTSDKYSTAYDAKYDALAFTWVCTPIPGDGMNEMKNWFNDNISRPRTVTPYFLRGGFNYETKNAGLYSVLGMNGSALNDYGFRVTLTPDYVE